MSQDTWENTPLTDDNIKIKMEMFVGGERFAMGLVVDNYKDLELKVLMDEIERKANFISKRFAAVFAGREELRAKQ